VKLVDLVRREKVELQAYPEKTEPPEKKGARALQGQQGLLDSLERGERPEPKGTTDLPVLKELL